MSGGGRIPPPGAFRVKYDIAQNSAGIIRVLSGIISVRFSVFRKYLILNAMAYRDCWSIRHRSVTIISNRSPVRVLNHDQSDHYANSVAFVVIKVRDPVTKELRNHFDGKLLLWKRHGRGITYPLSRVEPH